MAAAGASTGEVDYSTWCVCVVCWVGGASLWRWYVAYKDGVGWVKESGGLVGWGKNLGVILTGGSEKRQSIICGRI